MWRDDLLRNSFWRPWSNDYQVRLPTGVFEPTIERITRALYWHEYGRRLGATLQIRTYFLDSLKGMEDLLPGFTRRSVGGGQFLYGFQRFEPQPTVSTWLFVFHRRVFAGATTDVALQREMQEKMRRSDLTTP